VYSLRDIEVAGVVPTTSKVFYGRSANDHWA
jgi:hypothetical protein